MRRPADVDGRARDLRLLRRLTPFARPHATAFAGAGVLLALSAGAKLAGPQILRFAIDGPIARGDVGGLVAYAALFLAAEVAESALDAGHSLIVRLRGQRILETLRSALFAKAQRLPTSYFDLTPGGKIVARMTSDVATLSDLFTSGLLALAGDLLLLGGIVAALWRIHPPLALAAYAVVPALTTIAEVFRRRLRAAFRAVRETTARLTGRLQELLRGVEVVRLHAVEPWAEGELDRANAAHRDAFLRSVHLYALFFPVVELVSSVTLALVLWRGGRGVVGGELSFGALVAFFEYLHKFFRPVRDLSDKYSVLQASLASLERVAEFLDLPEQRAGGSHRAAVVGRVAFEGIGFAYPGGAPVLKDVSLRAEPGEVLALVGPTGAGKTTLLHLFLSLYQPTAGRVLLDGIDLPDWEPEALRERVTFVPQDVFLFDGTMVDNIRFGRPWVGREAALSAAGAVGLDAVVGPLAGGYDTPLGEGGVALSGGQRQLVAFARALAGGPAVLVLDEATSQVDQATEAVVEAALETLLRGRTCLVVAHRLSTVRRATRIAVLSRGQVVEEGPHVELLARGGLYRMLYELQFRTSP